MRRFEWLLVGAAAVVLSSQAAQVRFALVGDYGVDNPDELAVANLIKTNFQPDFIVTCGDNQYGVSASDIDRNIGKYYHDYIGNYRGSFGSGASSNRFFPALGNHDYLEPQGYSAHLAYFTLPGNERYYDFVRGPIHVFIVNSEVHEPDGISASSGQARWLSNRLAASVSPWKLVVSGDAHNYERIVSQDFPYFVNGAGGAPLASFGAPVGGSVVRYNAAHGAMLVIAEERQLTFEFHSVVGGGTRVDRYMLFQPPILEVVRQTNRVVLRWPTNGAASFRLQYTATPWNPSSWLFGTNAPLLSADDYTFTEPSSEPRRFFRLRRP